jgi:hypothetical protein
MTMSDDQRRRLEEARSRREAELAQLAETARQSFASYLVELLRPFVRKAVDAVWNFFAVLSDNYISPSTTTRSRQN